MTDLPATNSLALQVIHDRRCLPYSATVLYCCKLNVLYVYKWGVALVPRVYVSGGFKYAMLTTAVQHD